MGLVFVQKSWATSKVDSLGEVQRKFAAGYPASKVGLKGC